MSFEVEFSGHGLDVGDRLGLPYSPELSEPFAGGSLNVQPASIAVVQGQRPMSDKGVLEVLRAKEFGGKEGKNEDDETDHDFFFFLDAFVFFLFF